MPLKKTPCIKIRGVKTFELDDDMSNFCLFCRNIFFSHLVLRFGSNRRYLHVSRKTNLVQFTTFKSFHPPPSRLDILYYIFCVVIAEYVLYTPDMKPCSLIILCSPVNHLQHMTDVEHSCFLGCVSQKHH